VSAVEFGVRKVYDAETSNKGFCLESKSIRELLIRKLAEPNSSCNEGTKAVTHHFIQRHPVFLIQVRNFLPQEDLLQRYPKAVNITR